MKLKITWNIFYIASANELADEIPTDKADRHL